MELNALSEMYMRFRVDKHCLSFSAIKSSLSFFIAFSFCFFFLIKRTAIHLQVASSTSCLKITKILATSLQNTVRMVRGGFEGPPSSLVVGKRVYFGLRTAMARAGSLEAPDSMWKGFGEGEGVVRERGGEEDASIEITKNNCRAGCIHLRRNLLSGPASARR